MNLGEALSLLKKEKSKLVRMISLRKENVYFEEDTKPEFDTKKLTNEIDSEIDNIRILKIRILKTNLNTKLQGDSISLAEAIIKVGDIRSKLAKLSDLFERKRDWYMEKETKKKIAQISESEIEDEIEKLEIEKGILDNKLQMTNWNTKLSE